MSSFKHSQHWRSLHLSYSVPETKDNAKSALINAIGFHLESTDTSSLIALGCCVLHIPTKSVHFP